MFELICVTNRRLSREDFFTRLERLARLRPAAIILREKDLEPQEYRRLAKEAMAVCARHGVRLIAHYFVEEALEVRAEALHLPLNLLRSLSPKQKSSFKSLGASCHSLAELELAQALGCTYILVGHIFETASKQGLAGRGLTFLRQACAASRRPLYAIGGLRPKNIGLVQAAGAQGAALMSGPMLCEDPFEFWRSLRAGLRPSD